GAVTVTTSPSRADTRSTSAVRGTRPGFGRYSFDALGTKPTTSNSSRTELPSAPSTSVFKRHGFYDSLALRLSLCSSAGPTRPRHDTSQCARPGPVIPAAATNRPHRTMRHRASDVYVEGVTSPNILIVMTDEERYPPPYETDAVTAFRRSQLPARESLRADDV